MGPLSSKWAEARQALCPSMMPQGPLLRLAPKALTEEVETLLGTLGKDAGGPTTAKMSSE